MCAAVSLGFSSGVQCLLGGFAGRLWAAGAGCWCEGAGLPRRRLVPVSEGIVEELAAVARRSGLSVPELADAILGQAVRVLRSRDDVAGVLADAVVLADVARLGGAPVPFQALARLLEAVDEEVFEGFVGEAAGLARLVAMSARARGVEPGHGLGVVLRTLYPGAAVDVLVEEEGGAQVVVASPLLRGRVLRLVEEAARAAAEGFGDVVAEAEASPCLVALRLRRTGGGGGRG